MEKQLKNDFEKFVKTAGFSKKNIEIKENYLNIVQEIQYPDHYEYKEKDLESLSKLENKYKAKLITTEKDYLRISPFLRKKFDYVKLELKFQDEEGFKSNLKKFII